MPLFRFLVLVVEVSDLIDPWNFSNPMCRLCGMDTETPAHLIESCTRLNDPRVRIFRYEDKLPDEWETHDLSDFLLLIAEKMETISYTPIEMYVINQEGMEVLLMVDPMEEELRY